MTVSAVQSWMSDVGSAMTSVATELEVAAPSGGFAAVLARVAATLDAGPQGEPSSGSAAGAAAGGSAGSAGSVSSAGATDATGTVLGDFGVTGGAGSATGEAVVDEAEKFLGVPYVWGGASPTGFDCSGLVQYVYGQLGVSLPRTSEEQALVGTAVPGLTQARPGDLVFFAGSDGTATAPGHVGIYVGDGLMVDAPHTGADVQVQPVSTAGPVVAIRRVLSTAPTGGAVPANLAPLFAAAATTYGVPVTLLTSVARHESDFDPDARSSAGAEGLMQLMPGTAASLGVTPFTPGQAVDGAAQLLAGYLHQFGSTPLALAAYNAGPAAVEQYGGVPPYAETEAYVGAVMETAGVPATGEAQ